MGVAGWNSKMTSFISAIALLIAALGFLLIAIFANRMAKSLSQYLVSRSVAHADRQAAKRLLGEAVDKLLDQSPKG